MTDPLVAAANAISTASPQVRKFAQMSAARTIALEQQVAALTPPAPTPQGHTPRLCLVKQGSSLAGFTNLDKYTMAIVSQPGVADAKAKMPNAIKLLYANASQVVTAYTEGLSYTTAKANGWLLGEVPPTGSGHWVVDHTQAALNTAQAQAIATYVAVNGMNGCFLDDTIPINPYGVTTPPGWRDGMVSMVHQLRDLLHAQGGKLFCNANAFADPSLGNGDDGTGDVAWAKLLAPDGVMEENWMQARNQTLGTLRLRGNAWNADFDQWAAAAAQIQAAGIDLIGLTYNPTAAAHTYGAASLLLVDQGRSFVAGANADGSDAWGTWADQVAGLGAPTSAALTTTAGVAKPARSYTNGTVTVDPAAGTATL